MRRIIIPLLLAVIHHRCFYLYKRGSENWNLSVILYMNFDVTLSKGAKIRNQYNKVPHLAQDINKKVTNSQLYTTNESQEVSLFPAGDHKAHINRCAQRHSKHKTAQNIKYPQKKYRFGTVSKIFYWRA